MSTIQVALGQPVEETVIKPEFIKMPEESIDYGIMEKVDDIYVIPCRLGWDYVTLICAKDKAQEVKRLLNELRSQQLEEYLSFFNEMGNEDGKKCISYRNYWAGWFVFSRVIVG
ncbi:hypothetical protein KCTCHS21_50840 [Cohnella abietis]|uniref:Uncharacterized protein n=1 Tax=Cohnella abietis TaxID=2507935 RepID=A0A3T1DCL3_9BACL|nr:hypothetical protein KCTCHS21_50840 [Cohnella abietis]